MTRDRDQVQNTGSQVVLDYLVRPGRNAKELLDGLHIWFDDGRSRQRLKLLVSRCMIAMSMSVGDYERNRVTLVSAEPVVDDRPHVAANFSLAGSSVKQQRLVFAEQQVEEWLFIVGTARLPENVKVFVVFMYLKLRDLYAFGAAEQP